MSRALASARPRTYGSGPSPGLRRQDGGREGAGGLLGGRAGQYRGFAVGYEVAVAGLPVREFGAVLLPVGESRLVAPVVQAGHRDVVRVGVHVGVDRRAVPPGGHRPPGVVRLGQCVRAEVAKPQDR